MSSKQRRVSPSVIRLVMALVLGALNLFLRAFFSQCDRSFSSAYRQVSKAVMAMLASAASVVPFALWDWLVVLGFIWFVAVCVRRVKRHQPLRGPLSVAALVLAVAFTVFSSGWALNHYAPSLAEEMGLEVGKYSLEELEVATEYYLLRAVDGATHVPRDNNGRLSRQDFFELAAIAGRSYENLEQRFSIFKGTKLPVKALLLAGEPLLYSGHVGIFFSPTAESSVPLNCASEELPFVMCHEAAHRLAIASEEEANFSAYLACSASADVRFVYAGDLCAFSHCIKALARQSSEHAQMLLSRVAGLVGEDALKQVLEDRRTMASHYDSYEGVFKELGTSVNDGYLRAYGESEGVRSYGLVVDYLIAWYQTGV